MCRQAQLQRATPRKCCVSACASQFLRLSPHDKPDKIAQNSDILGETGYFLPVFKAHFWKGISHLVIAIGVATTNFGPSIYASPNNASHYQAAPPVKIMALGDSLTAGEGVNGYQSYRGYLYQLLTTAGHKVDFVGSQASPTATEADEDHEGHAGFTIGPDNARYCNTINNELACGTEHYNLYDNVENWLKQSNPDIVLLNIGINDMLPQVVAVGGAGVNRSVDPDRAAPQLKGLVNRIREFAPNAKIIVSSLLRVSWRDGADWPAYRMVNTMARELGQNRDDGIYFVDLNAISLQSGDFHDSLHLTNAGARKVALAWFEVLNPLLQNWQPIIVPTPTPKIEPEVQPCEGNLLKNPTFAEGLANWEDWGGAVVSGESHVGRALQIGPSVGGAGQMVPAIAASSYTLSLWAKRTGKPVWAGFGIAFWDSGNSKLAMYSIDNIASTYATYTITAVAPWGATRAQVWAWTNGEDGNLYVDDICLLPTWLAQRNAPVAAAAIKPTITGTPFIQPKLINTPMPKPVTRQAVAPAAVRKPPQPVVQTIKKQVRATPTPVRKR